jgi:uncharacterized protein (TIGR03435 family)
MRKCTAVTSLVLLWGAGLNTAVAGEPEQTVLRFEVASVRLLTPGAVAPPSTGGPGTSDPERITWGGGLLGLFKTVYGVDFDQFSAPDWASQQGYVISAIVPKGATVEQVRIMWQNLLADRFHLKTHRLQREYPVYELSVARGGPKLKKSGEPGAALAPGFPVVPPGARRATSATVRDVRMTFRDASMADLINRLGWPLAAWGESGGLTMGRIVDKTGLDARYDFNFEFAGFMGAGGAFPPPPPEGQIDTAPPLLDALRLQLGLQIEKKKTTLDFWVIDHVDRIPTEN